MEMAGTAMSPNHSYSLPLGQWKEIGFKIDYILSKRGKGNNRPTVPGFITNMLPYGVTVRLSTLWREIDIFKHGPNNLDVRIADI